MRSVFATIGGSGSTYLIRKLATRYEVGNKPDTIFRSRIPSLRIGDLNRDQGSLSTRARGFVEFQNETIDEFLVRYLDFLQMKADRTAVFNTCGELGLFSKHRIVGVVFLIRHPLHAYSSWAKQERHGKIVAFMGGINSNASISRYAERWCANIEEAFRLKESGPVGGLVRFEHARVDAQILPELFWVFSDWDTSKRNYGFLSPESEGFLRQLTEHYTTELYGKDDFWSPT